MHPILENVLSKILDAAVQTCLDKLCPRDPPPTDSPPNGPPPIDPPPTSHCETCCSKDLLLAYRDLQKEFRMREQVQERRRRKLMIRRQQRAHSI